VRERSARTESIYGDIKGGHKIESEKGRGKHASNNGDSEWTTTFGPRAEAECDGKNPDDGGEGGHEDGSKPKAARFEHGLEGGDTESPLLIGELNQKNGIFGDETQKKDQADQAVKIQIHRRNFWNHSENNSQWFR
jgi:hypothetical protein